MEFNDSDLQEFIAIWKHEFGETLTLDEARHRAHRVMTLYEVLVTNEQKPRDEEHPEG